MKYYAPQTIPHSRGDQSRSWLLTLDGEILYLRKVIRAKKREFICRVSRWHGNMLNNLLLACVQYKFSNSIEYTIHEYHSPGKLSRPDNLSSGEIGV